MGHRGAVAQETAGAVVVRREGLGGGGELLGDGGEGDGGVGGGGGEAGGVGGACIGRQVVGGR